MKKTLIIGATSVIAERCARIWAARSDSLFLVGRNKERLDTIAADLQARGAKMAIAYTMDANDFEAHDPMLNEAEEKLGGIDRVLIAHGTLSDQSKCEKDIQLTMNEIRANALSVLALLTHIANRFEEKKSGTIAVISSVAGERGRASNYVYGSAKAMVTTFTSGLRQRLYKSNVSVVTIKPGFVDTPMTANFKKGLLWVGPNYVAKKIVFSIDRRRNEIYVPFFWREIMRVIKILPDRILIKLKL